MTIIKKLYREKIILIISDVFLHGFSFYMFRYPHPDFEQAVEILDYDMRCLI